MSSDLTKQEKKALKHQNKAAKHEDKAARKQEKKMRKEMKKDKHLKDKHLHDSRGGVAPALVGSGLGAAPVVHTAATPVPVVPVAPVAAVAPVLAERVVHEPERVIQHQPLHETEIINEHPVEVKREHHIQPVIHETEHRIQPIIKTEATTETSYIVQDKNVMLPPIVEPPHMVGAVAAAPSIAPATNTLPATAPFPTASRSAALPVGAYDESLHHHHGHKADKMVHHHDEKHLHEHHHADKKHLHKHGNTHLDDRQLYHQDMMMRRGGYYPGAAWNQHHYNQYPNMMMMRGAPYWGPQQHHHMMMMPGYNRGVYGPNGRLMHTEDAIHGSMIAPLAAGETVIPIEGAHTSRGLKDKLHLGSSHSHSRHEGEVMPTTASTAAAPGLLPGTETSSLQNKAGFGQKIKGAIKEVQGVVTRNPAKKEEGRMIMQGADPASGAVSSAPTATTAI